MSNNTLLKARQHSPTIGDRFKTNDIAVVSDNDETKPKADKLEYTVKIFMIIDSPVQSTLVEKN